MEIVWVIGALGFFGITALIEWYFYWVAKQHFASFEDMKVIFDEVKKANTNINELSNVLAEISKSQIVIPANGNGNGNGHKEEELGTLAELACHNPVSEEVKEEETQPADLPSPEEQQQKINDRMAKARAAKVKK